MKWTPALTMSTVVAVLCMAMNARAALLAYDGFDYPTGPLTGNGSASDPGFSTAWTESGADGGGNVVAGGLTYANLAVTGGAVDMTDQINPSTPVTTLNFRGFDTQYDDPSDSPTGELWFSYLIQPGNYSGAPYMGISFYTDALAGTSASDTDFGIVANNRSGLKYGFSDHDITSNHLESSILPVSGETTLLVGRVILGGG